MCTHHLFVEEVNEEDIRGVQRRNWRRERGEHGKCDGKAHDQLLGVWCSVR